MGCAFKSRQLIFDIYKVFNHHSIRHIQQKLDVEYTDLTYFVAPSHLAFVTFEIGLKTLRYTCKILVFMASNQLFNKMQIPSKRHNKVPLFVMGCSISYMQHIQIESVV